MDAQQALADLTEISSQIQAAVVFDEKGKPVGSTLDDQKRAAELAAAAAKLLAAAEALQGGEPAQLEAATLEGSVFVVRDGKRRIAATTAADPTVGLVFYDLKSALRTLGAKPARKPVAKKPATPGSKKPPAAKTSASSKKPAASKKKPAARKPSPLKRADAS